MKLLILLTLFSSVAWSKPLVLISYFDAFNGASFNNSERVAKALELRLNGENSEIEVKLCSLNTIFDKAYAQTEDCLKNSGQRPVMMLGLGESTCQLKIETMMRNNDKTQGADNAGVHRNNTPVIAGAPGVLGLRYPLPQMYCALNETERTNLELSNSAGSFVCNNTAYQMSYYYPEMIYGFIHVPAHNCSRLAARNEEAVVMLEKMIKYGVNYLNQNEIIEGLPHLSNDLRLPTKRDELKRLRRQVDNKEECILEYLKRSKASDERRLIIFGSTMN